MKIEKRNKLTRVDRAGLIVFGPVVSSLELGNKVEICGHNSHDACCLKFDSVKYENGGFEKWMMIIHKEEIDERVMVKVGSSVPSSREVLGRERRTQRPVLYSLEVTF